MDTNKSSGVNAGLKQRIADIEQEIRETPYHKGTEHHIGKLRARIARLEDELFARQTASRRGGGGGGYAVRKTGDATVVLVGPPSVGKSTLLNALTNAKSHVAPYAFTTVSVIPGMMRYQDAAIQILDVPGIIEGASQGRGRGKEVLSVVRGADLLILITEVGKEDAFSTMEQELYQAGVRLNQAPSHIRVVKKASGGIIFHKGVRQTLSEETIKEVIEEFGIRNAEITLKQSMSIEQLVDALSHSRVFVPALFVVNKVDEAPHYHRDDNWIPVSAEKKLNLEMLRDKIRNALALVRVYLYNPDKNTTEPIIMKVGQNISHVLTKMGEQAKERYSQVKISGPGSKFPGQTVAFSYPLVEGMIITFT